MAVSKSFSRSWRLLSGSQKFSIFVILFLAIGIPLAVLGVKSSQFIRGRADEPNSSNLLKNSNFTDGNTAGFVNWTRTNNKWKGSKKIANPSPLDTAAEMDQDNGRLPDGSKGKIGWMYGDEDWLSQEVQATNAHQSVSFTITEIHHVTNSVAQIRLYGKLANGTWAKIWSRDNLSTIPPAKNGYDWHKNTYTVASNHSAYKLEFYGKYLSQEGKDGWKITLLNLEVH